MNPSMIKLGILLAVALSCLINRTEATVDPVNITCNGAKTFVANSSFDANLKSLLSSLISNASTNRFYNFVAGLNNQPNTVYGSFLCRGDLTPEKCKNCVDNATRDMIKTCSNVKESIIWYDKCSIRYSDINFFSKLVEEPHFFSSNGEPITGESPDELFGKILDIMGELATKLGTLSSLKRKVATKMVKLRWFSLYNYAECTPDINGADCSKCIRKAFSYLPSCCSKKIGGRVLLPSCSIRYENYPFYDDILKEVRRRPASSLKIAVGVSSTIFLLAIFTLVSFWLFRRKKLKKCSSRIDEIIDRKDYSNIDSMLFRLSQIKEATNNFCDENKLGQGGFGAVYKGILPDGREIAAKRLSKCSGQGAEEFKNEIESVTKLQHRNLVRLLGICFEGEEKILVYEFVPNRSLDYFLFDSDNRDQLDWPKRYKIIVGTARGLLYLHEDSRLRIIHRDLKASNVLLDSEMNPRISDFGTARIFGVDQIQGSTNRIVGTYGYMSPEYVMFGNFSVKSDVFSFGVLLLEIISSKKISTSKQEFGESLLDITWKHWKRGTPLEFMDPNLRTSCSQNEVIKVIHIGLLCVQKDMEDRPTMASVVAMLTSETTTLPLPRQPAFIISNAMNSQTSTSISSNMDIAIMTL